MSTRALIDERASLAKDAEKILTAAVAEQRELTAEENDRFDRIHEKVDALRDTIDRAEKQDKLTKELSEIRATSETKAAFTPGAETADADAKDKRHGEAFRAWMRDGMSELTPEQRTIMGEHRAQGTTPDTAGGYLVSAEFSNQLEAHLSAFGGMREAARVIQTATGADLHWPTTDDTFNEGELVAENTAVADQDVLYGEIVFSSYLYSSKMVRSSRSLLQDTNLFEGELSMQLAERIGRITNRHFTTGTGTGEPEGVVTAAGGNDLDGNALAAGTLGAIAYDDLSTSSTASTRPTGPAGTLVSCSAMPSSRSSRRSSTALADRCGNRSQPEALPTVRPTRSSATPTRSIRTWPASVRRRSPPASATSHATSSVTLSGSRCFASSSGTPNSSRSGS